MRRLSLLAALFATAFVPALAHADVTPAPMSAAQKAAVEQVIKEYLTKENPEVIMEAMRELQKRDQASADVKTNDALKKKKDQIYNDPNTPVGGNPKGDVTIVEFFDDQCGYCKMSEPFLEKILQEDKSVRFIYKEFPVLGPASVTASKASLAVFKTKGLDAYVKLHDALQNKKEHLSDDIVYQTVTDQGLDATQVKKEADSDAIDKIIQANLDLGSDIGVRGTPFFIIGGKAYPGAMQYEEFKKAVDDARAGKKG